MEKFVVDKSRPHLGGNILGGDKNTYCPPVWDYLIERFAPSTVIDVGCGEGYMVEYFIDRGISATGIEGLDINKTNSPVADKIILHDFADGVFVPILADMVISCEFVEHVEEKFMINYLPQFCRCKTLVFTHADAGQDGYHHVNCQGEGYWINLMEYFGFTHLFEDTKQARVLAGMTWWKSTLIFKK